MPPASAVSLHPGMLTAKTATLYLLAGTLEPSAFVRSAAVKPLTLNAAYVKTSKITTGIFSDTKDSPILGEITIAGHVVNASGGRNPTNVFVTLVIFENDQIINTIKIPLDGMGLFEFDTVPWNPNFAYQASVMYNGIEFDSELVDAGILLPGAAVHLSLPVYEVTTNSQFIEAVRMRVIYDFTSPGWVHIAESILISNPTSLVVVSPDNSTPILDFPLPKSATNVDFPDGNGTNRFRLTSNGFGDWQPVMPGNGHLVLVEYSIPFTNSWHSNLTSPIAIDSLMVMVKASGIITTSNGLQLSAAQSDPSSSTTVYAASSIESGRNISIIFTTQDQIQRIWLGIGIFTATILFALLWIIRANHIGNRAADIPAVAENGENVDTILDAIIALDDRYRHGDIAEDAYKRARAEYVDKLEALRDHGKD